MSQRDLDQGKPPAQGCNVSQRFNFAVGSAAMLVTAVATYLVYRLL